MTARDTDSEPVLSQFPDRHIGIGQAHLDDRDVWTGLWPGEAESR